MKRNLWVEKYRPSTIDDYVFCNSNHKDIISTILKTGNLPHLLLSGTPGTGKTTLAKILTNELEVDPSDILTINASDENSVDVMRDKIKTFITTASFESGIKVVHLSEADHISQPGQAILRSYLEEEYTDTCRFILTCNYTHKIIPALKSRCQHIEFNAHSKLSMFERLIHILDAEGVKYDAETLDSFVVTFGPDLRKIINELQRNSSTGTLVCNQSSETTSDAFTSLPNAIETGDWSTGRKTLAQNVSSDQWESLYTFLYESVETIPKFENDQSKLEEAFIVIAEYAYKHNIVAEPLINATAMLINLSKL